MCSFPADVIGLSKLASSFQLHFTQPLTGISARNIPGRKADNLTAVYEQLKKKVFEPIV
jgi:hypothetical protein